jgi:hypothetical protein
MKSSFQTVMWQWCKADNSFHLTRRLRKSGALPPHIQHAFKKWAGATLPLHVLKNLSVKIKRNEFYLCSREEIWRFLLQEEE